MAINLFANRPHACVARQTISFVDAGLTVNNMYIIYLVDGYLRSWRPERIINGITGFEAGKGYYIIPKQDLDLEAYLIPPLVDNGIYNGVYA